jgi:sec-independent protein translocase protein TatC
VTVALSYVRLVNPHFLARQRRIAVLAIITLLAIVTPTTDIVTLGIVAVPAIALWEIGLVVSKAIYPRR